MFDNWKQKSKVKGNHATNEKKYSYIQLVFEIMVMLVGRSSHLAQSQDKKGKEKWKKSKR